MATTKPLDGHLALITGCTGGIGRATALLLASKGASIAVHYNTNVSAAEALVSTLQASGVRAAAFRADMADYDAVRRLHRDVVSALGEPSVLFNNAGVSNWDPRDGTPRIEDVGVELFENASFLSTKPRARSSEQTWRTNTASAYLLTQLCVPSMERRGYGRVVFNSSIAALTGGVIGPHYASSKAALHGLLHWLSARYCKCGITVNGVAPALITGTALLPGEPEELRKRIPVGRLGDPGEVADVVAMLVTNAYMTNHVIPVDGGWYAQ